MTTFSQDQLNLLAQAVAQQSEPAPGLGLAQGMIGSPFAYSVGLLSSTPQMSPSSLDSVKPNGKKCWPRWLGGGSVGSIEELEAARLMAMTVRQVVYVVVGALTLWVGGCTVRQIHQNHAMTENEYEHQKVGETVIWQKVRWVLQPDTAPVAPPVSLSHGHETGGAEPYPPSSQTRLLHLTGTLLKLQQAERE